MADNDFISGLSGSEVLTLLGYADDLLSGISTASSTAYGDEGNGVSAEDAATVISDSKDSNIGAGAAEQTGVDCDAITKIGFYNVDPTSTNTPYSGTWFISVIGSNDGLSRVTQIATSQETDNVVLIRHRFNSAWSDWDEFWHTGNTTVDASGFIKEASPIVKLFSDTAEFNSKCPDSALFEKVNIGHYLIKGTSGFSQNGWYIETPKDANGNVKVYTEYSQLDDNTIEIKTYEPDYSAGKITGVIPVDITEGRWIDLRLEATQED